MRLARFTGSRPGADAPLQPDPLRDVARRAGSGQRRAAGELVRRIGPAMLAAIRKVLSPGTVEAEDVLQESVEGLLLALPSFRYECTVMHFACRVAVLSALVWRRRAAFRASFAHDEAHEALAGVASPSPSPAEDLDARRRRAALGALLDDLPPVQAEVLVLHCALGFTVQELAATSRCPVETVRSRLRLAKETLRERIGASSELAEVLELQR